MCQCPLLFLLLLFCFHFPIPVFFSCLLLLSSSFLSSSFGVPPLLLPFLSAPVPPFSLPPVVPFVLSSSSFASQSLFHLPPPPPSFPTLSALSFLLLPFRSSFFFPLLSASSSFPLSSLPVRLCFSFLLWFSSSSSFSFVVCCFSFLSSSFGVTTPAPSFSLYSSSFLSLFLLFFPSFRDLSLLRCLLSLSLLLLLLLLLFLLLFQLPLLLCLWSSFFFSSSFGFFFIPSFFLLVASSVSAVFLSSSGFFLFFFCFFECFTSFRACSLCFSVAYHLLVCWFLQSGGLAFVRLFLLSPLSAVFLREVSSRSSLLLSTLRLLAAQPYSARLSSFPPRPPLRVFPCFFFFALPYFRDSSSGSGSA